MSGLGKHIAKIIFFFRVWSRSVCMNESLEKGSKLPFCEIAQKNNLAVLIMNLNFNRDPKTKVIKFVNMI